MNLTSPIATPGFSPSRINFIPIAGAKKTKRSGRATATSHLERVPADASVKTSP